MINIQAIPRGQASDNSSDLAINISHRYSENIAYHIFIQALRDAIGVGDARHNSFLRSDARYWLSSNESTAIVESAGFEHEQIKKWVASGCPVFKYPYKRKGT
jgi:hypothetical protein